MKTSAVPAAAAAILAVSLSSCASSSPRTSVDFSDNYRFAGSLSGVRVDAQLVGDPGRAPFRVVFEIENGREEEIALVPAASLASYNERERTITLSLGAEVPDSYEMIVERVRPGERRRFTATADAGRSGLTNPRLRQAARFVRVRLTYLRQLDGFEIDQADPQRSSIRVTDALLPVWLERNESLFTNVLPFQAVAGGGAGPSAERRGPTGFHPVGPRSPIR